MEIKAISGGVDSVMVEKNCSFIIETSIGNVTMCGEILNNEIQERATGPYFWNKDKFYKLSVKERELVVDCVHNELSKFLE